MMKLLICCIYVVYYKQSFADGLKSNLQITKRDQIASQLLLLQQLAPHYYERDYSQNKLSGDLYDRLASKMNKYDADKIEMKIQNIVVISDALNKRDVDRSKVGARNRIRRSVDDMMQGCSPECDRAELEVRN
ncbi:hypothetical protein SNE40_008697 [Patella caerulea]